MRKLRTQSRVGDLTVLQIMESLVHAAVIHPPARFSVKEIERAIADVVLAIS